MRTMHQKEYSRGKYYQLTHDYLCIPRDWLTRKQKETRQASGTAPGRVARHGTRSPNAPSAIARRMGPHPLSPAALRGPRRNANDAACGPVLSGLVRGVVACLMIPGLGGGNIRHG